MVKHPPTTEAKSPQPTDQAAGVSDAAFEQHDHRNCAQAGLAAADTLAQAQRLRLTPVRRRVLEILLEEHRAMGAYEVLERLAKDGFGHQPPVAYRALDFLVDHGMAHRIQRLNAFTACHHMGQDHIPAFLICRVCHTLSETEAPALNAALSELSGESGFALERASIEALGVCPDCRDSAPQGDANV